ncbi:2-C-methyl-D-erythritol 4-phosphate cytidylyltransferase [Pelotomaculum isophthalicicum JI]|uniref:2-C-methyl-D-erythritol 4-phosphate cytidylyltransferase n=1 Tax=Pelotomaculum isophthalicicum JI TaxID=947010 RepID=A0A9X4H0V4_9FIRM|nr:2-C-methyl-D-erythritol 4-phosphate cytidylyltransferase [Pelotomaculum isophthalicicum]MDF9407515.1 2-C-methyl-D-erythritol 4-phosphate cytidylyltransferase [Pelotomaculum isophthalicicum JI]
MVKVAAVIPAAGRGARMGLPVKKQFLQLEGIPVIGHTLKVIADSPVVHDIVLVASPGEEAYCRNAIVERFGIRKIAAIVPGGSERQESVYNGLLALSADTDIVLIHDGARPLLRPEELPAIVDAGARYGAATLAVPVKDTVKLSGEDEFVAGTLPRERLWLTQTPQAFRYQLIIEAHQRAMQGKYTGTDDAGLVEILGQPVKIVAGSYENLKITTPEDLLVASAIIKARRASG